MSRSKLELWGGIECTLVRIGEDYRDETDETGHRSRLDDLDRIAALGIRRLRYPVLWETIAPNDPAIVDWAWHDERLARMRDLGIAPIAGLLHHGSGPRYTNLLDPAFPRLFAAHAARVARRYPWIDAYTPINEPLTTARFSALYGYWYPHRCHEQDFLKALVAQCRATLLAMRAIRKVNPDAKLVQTEDVGRIFSTPELAGQAEYENERGWLSLDLLCGRVDRHHPWRRRLADHGIGPDALRIFLSGEGAPDIVGVNHYLTSERFLDERLERYPAHLAGGNGAIRYADVEAVRVDLAAQALGPGARLRDVWRRYRRPIAVTEVHHGSTRDEQLRWLSEVWQAAEKERRLGADIRAVTVWSLFGAADWNSLLLRREGIYEPGAFDVRGPAPRPTALARATASLTATGAFDHPVLDVPGWWHRSRRFYAGEIDARIPQAASRAKARRLLVVGPSSILADAFMRVATERGLVSEFLPSRDDAALALPRSPAALRDSGVWALVDVRSGVLGGLGAICRDAGLAYLSCRPVRPSEFRNRHPTLYETDGPDLIVRTGPLFGPWSPGDVVHRLRGDLALGRRLRLAHDIVSPTYLPDLAHVALDLLIDGAEGQYNLFSGSTSWRALAAELVGRSGLPGHGAPDLHRAPLRDHTLATRRGVLMPSLSSALDRLAATCPPDRVAEGLLAAAE